MIEEIVSAFGVGFDGCCKWWSTYSDIFVEWLFIEETIGLPGRFSFYALWVIVLALVFLHCVILSLQHFFLADHGLLCTCQ